MNKLLVFLFILCLQFTAVGQSNNYDIASYIYPDVQRKTLSLQPFLNMFATNGGINRDYNTVAIDIPLFGSERLYNRKRQLDLSYIIDVGYNHFSKDTPFTRANNKFYGGLRTNIENRFFFQPKRFFEVEANLLFDYNPDYYSAGENRNEIILDLNVSPKIGFGRTELVTDAWHAVAIVEELQKAGCLNKVLSSEEMNSLAQEISRLKNYRNVDLRLESIYEFEALVKHFIDNGYVDSDQYRFFALLDDFYDFEGFRTRLHGSQFKAGVDLGYEYTNNDFSSSRSQTLNTYSLVFEYENYKAISTDWQFDQNYRLNGGLWTFSPFRTELSDTNEFAELAISYTLGYYLSLRTNFRLSLIGSYYYVNNATDVYGIFLSPSYNYYISPQLRFRISSDINVSRSATNTLFHSDTRSASLTAGIRYYFY